MGRSFILSIAAALVASVWAPCLAPASAKFAPAGYTEAPGNAWTASSMSLSPPATNLPYGAQTQDQSSFAMGSMVWNVIFVQGNGAIQTQQETWTPAELSNIQTKIGQAKTYWEGLTSGLHSGAQLSINVNYVNAGSPLLTGYEPSKDQSEVWINSIMSQVGSYNSSDRYANVRNFNQDQRIAANTNWATTIFVMDNTSAHLTSYAYAYLGGPFAILQNDSAGWGPQNFNLVLSHEMGHILNALDEYAASGAKTTDRGGYLNTLNGNASLDASGNPVTPPQPNALMLNNGNYSTHVPYSPSVFSKDMYGFRDSDGDTIPDILDTLPLLTGNDAGSDPATGLFHFAGSVQVTTLDNQNPNNIGFSNSLSDMTINTITGAYYSLDGGAASLFPAVSGSYGGYVESLEFQLAGLASGLHTIDVYGINSVDNASNTLHFDFTSQFSDDQDPVVPEPLSLALLGMGLTGLARYARRRRDAQGTR